MSDQIDKQMRTGGAAVVAALQHEGINHAFCVPGESFMGILDALYDAPDIRVVSARHEGGAAFMAEAWGKATGRPALCMATRGVGSTNLAIGVHTARQDSTPLIAIVGQVNRGFRHREAFQEIDLAEMYRHIAKWSVEVNEVDRLPELIHRAVQTAISGRPGPVLLSIPQDVLTDWTDAPLLPPARAPLARPAARDIEAALALLRGARRPAIIAGGGVISSQAHSQLLALAEALELPVAASWRRSDVFPNDHRLFLGTTGLSAPPPLLGWLLEADVLLIIGTRLGENASHGYRLPGMYSRIIHIDADADMLGLNFVPEVSIAADARLALSDLLAAAEETPLPAGLRAERRAANDADHAAYIQTCTPRPQTSSTPVDPEGVIADLQRILPPETIMVSDVGNFSGWLGRYYRFQQPGTFIAPTSGAMGYGLPAAIAAKLAHPALPVVTVVGDGSLLMTLSELETAVREHTPLVVLVFDNQMYGTIRMHQEQDHPGRVLATNLGTPDLARTAESFGALGFNVRDNADLASALTEALAADKPALIHMHVDPERISVYRTLGEISGSMGDNV